MEAKDIILASLGALGWIWAVVQFFLNRRNQKKDKIIERRFQVYSEYLRKSDEVMEKIRSDPKNTLNLATKFFPKIMTENLEEMDRALISFNSELIESTKRSVEPILILTQEMNNIKLICSEEMLPKIEEYRKLALDFSNDFQQELSSLSNNLGDTTEKLESLGNDQRPKRLNDLNTEIQNLMRKEILY